MTDYVDFHAHYNHPDYFQALDATGLWDEVGIMKVLGHLWRPKPDHEGPQARALSAGSDEALQRRLAAMDEAGIARQVINLGAPHPYLSDRAAGADMAALVNGLFADAARRAGGRLLTLAVLPLPHVEDSLDEARGALADPQCIGVGLGCSAHGIALDDERFDPLWSLLDEHRAVVYLHPGVGIDGVVGCTDFHLAPDFVSPAEMSVAICRLIVRGVVLRYPDITFVAATLGGMIPFLAHRFDRGLLQDNPEDHERIGGAMQHFRRLFYDTSVIEEPVALFAAREAGLGDRMLLGSDYSRPSIDLNEAVRFVSGSRYLDDDQKRATLSGNAGGILARAGIA